MCLIKEEAPMNNYHHHYTFHICHVSCRFVAPNLKKNRMYDLGGTVPYVLKSCNLRRTNNYCARFGQTGNYIPAAILMYA